MLIYETEGFLEVESKEIQQLCRSAVSLSLGDAEDEAFAVHAVLCNHSTPAEQRCHVAFYSKALKRAFVFVVKVFAEQSPWQYGQETLEQLGFQLEDVNLTLSPAMQEVVLRDVPGLLSPAEARKQRTEKSTLLAKLQDDYDKAPDSAQGKKAALKLSNEVRLNGLSEELRLLLDGLLSSNEAAQADIQALVSQVQELTSRLESATALAENERSQREMSESITAAAEKRIQELETVLVDVETKSAETLKQKRKVTQLRKRIKALGVDLDAAESDTAKEREKQEQFIADINAAHERVASLEKEREKTETVLKDVQTKLAEEQAEKSQLSEELKSAKLQVKDLSKELQNAEKKIVQQDVEVKMSENLHAELAEVQQALQGSLGLNRDLKEELATADQKCEGLQERLQETELCIETFDKELKAAEKKVTQYDETVKTIEVVRTQLVEAQQALKKSLDLNSTLEEKLATAIEENESSKESLRETPTMPADEKDSAKNSQEIASLKAELQELMQKFKAARQSQDELEAEVDEAHKLIDSLEKMLRETDNATKERRSYEKSKESESQKVQELDKKLKTLESQLEQELIEQKRLVKAVSAAEKKIAEQEEALRQDESMRKEQGVELEKKACQVVVEESVPQSPLKPVKPLPHELRPAAKKGAFFRPDWDLKGLPCQSSKEVFKAWEAAFNVQISLEGYTSQYCMAFLVVTCVKEQKKLYLLYRLKLSKHTLICIPAKPLTDEASLQKAVEEGLNFLKVSGFEMDEMLGENIDSTLRPYFLEG